ncbi:MAG: ABC transporter permease [bacterium]|nr:ABC transporter permease [bacterium]
MRFHRIIAVLLRYLYEFKRQGHRLVDVFYWPVVDLLLWGLTSVFVKSFAPELPNIVLIIVSGIVFWLFVWRAQSDMSISLLDDLWNKNLINMFVSPLKFSEWIISFIILGFLKIIIGFLFAALIAFILYQVNIFYFGFYLIPFALLLMMTGWWVGMFVNSLIMRLGSNMETLAWSMVMVISPFSAIYYPLSILPGWMQKISLLVPTSYIFEGARQVIDQGTLDWSKIIISLALNLIYLLLAIIFLKKSFKKMLQRGLISLY